MPRAGVRALVDRHVDGTVTSNERAELDEITVLDQLCTLARARLLAARGGFEHNLTDA
jgi:hypothetical protein